MNSSLDIYKNRTVLITGNTGFKGSWLSLWLIELGAKVIGYSLEPPTQPNLFEAVNLSDRITHITGDVRDGRHVDEVFEKYQPEFVFHMAAQALVERSYQKPKLTYETNVMGTVNILETLRRIESVRACIIVTSDKCYENKEKVYRYREEDPMGGYDPYSSSKGCAELVTRAYRNSFFNNKCYGKKHNISVSSVRAGNVVGGGDWAEDRIIPDCLRALCDNKAIMIRKPSAIRPWQYVLEPLAGYLRLGALMYKGGDRFSGAWNFGPDNENVLQVKDLVELVLEYWGGGNCEIDTSAHAHEVCLLDLDSSKAKEKLKWKPIYDIRETVKRTIGWYKKFYSNMGPQNITEFTLNEILDYTTHVYSEYLQGVY